MSVGLVPVHHAASVVRVDSHVLGTAHRAAVLDPGRLDAPENRIELLLVDTEAEVLDGKRAVVIDEVEGQAVVDVHGRERPGSGFGPAHAKKVGEKLGRGPLVSGGNDGVIELDRHFADLLSVRARASAPRPGAVPDASLPARFTRSWPPDRATAAGAPICGSATRLRSNSLPRNWPRA